MKIVYSSKLDKDITICKIKEYDKCKSESKYTEREVDLLKRANIPEKQLRSLDKFKNILLELDKGAIITDIKEIKNER